MAVCPICNKHPPEPALKPFCSRRCADIDLGRWFTGSYAIPVRPDEGEDEDAIRAPDKSGEEDA